MRFHPRLELQLQKAGLASDPAAWKDSPLLALFEQIEQSYREADRHSRESQAAACAEMRPSVTVQQDQGLPSIESRLKRLLRMATDWLWESDAAGRLTALSSGFERSFGMPAAQAIGRTPQELWPHAPEVARGSILLRHFALRQPFADVPVRLETAEGRVVELQLSGEPLWGASGEFCGFSGVAHDVTEVKLAQREMERRSMQDALTGLGNRRRLQRDALALIALGQPFVLTLIDLDQFKAINDAEGHLEGDRFLVEIARRLRAQAEFNDGVYRLSGDEFMLLAQGDPSKILARLDRELLAAIRPPHANDRVSLLARASAGSAVFPVHGRNLDELLVAADVAMYAAKHAGGHRHFHYSTSLYEDWQKRTTHAQSLSSAIENHGLLFDYQPVFDRSAQSCIGYEALLRWPACSLPELGPQQIVAQIEQRGLAASFRQWCVHRVESDAASMLRPDRALFIALNLSPLQLSESSLLPALIRLNQALKARNGHLLVELTESPTSLDTSALAEPLRILAGAGITIALDDFGQGMSSLERLIRLPVQRLKLDRFMIERIEEQAERQQMVRAILTLAHTLGLRVIAEGVETPAELGVLQRLGVDELQGFWLGRPQAADCWKDAGHAVMDRNYSPI